MVALEAWALGKPVLANARCDVLQGQCLRSNGGLYYHGFQEFFETLRAIDSNAGLAAALGRNGRTYFQRHYSWPVIEQKYLDMLRTLAAETPARVMEPLPGWWARRRQTLPAADGVVRALPTGPVRLRSGEDSGSKMVDDRRASIDDSRPRADGRPGRPERDERPRSIPTPPPIQPPRSQERAHPSIANRQSAPTPDPQSAPIRNGDRRGRPPRRRGGPGGRGSGGRGGSGRGNGGRRPGGGR
jgi:hypothetical protein